MPTTTIIEEYNFGIYAIATRTDESATELDDLSAEEARTILELFTPGFVKHDNAFLVQHVSGMNLEIGSGNAKNDLYLVPSISSGQGNYLVRLNPSVVPVTVPAADPSSTRTDEIYLIVTDGNYEGGNLYLPRLAYRQGDAGAGAPGPEGTWNSYALLSSIPVPASASSPGSLSDQRVRAGVIAGVGGSIPVGGIIMWSGTVANIPSGWRLCDGGGGTPDLRGRFVAGAGGSYSVGNTGGADTVTLTTSQMPSHNHSGPSHTHSSGGLSIGSNGGHRHNVNIRTSPPTSSEAHAHGAHNISPSNNRLAGAPVGTGSSSSDNVDNGIRNVSNHSHSISGSTGSSGTGNTGSTGSGSSHENRPPYYALAFIQRVQ